ncbi:MAG TPA: hypothetical protein VEX62_01625, partial [Candidatus Limnocylindrales bacterium]|nr:hypothetical protein [Candidatus Limnocylindrales bacterium]
MKRTIAVFVTALTVLTTGTILGASVAPTHLEGSSNAGKECTDVYPNVEGLQQLKIEGATPEDPFPGSGNYNDGTLFVSIVMPSATGTSANSIDWTSNIDVLGVVVKDGTDGANWYDYSPAGSQGDDNLITPADGRRGISHVSFCYVPGGADAAADLTVEKTAVPAFTRTFDWTIDKSADTATVYSAGGGESSEVEYTITVTKLAGVDSAWSVSGSITVTNPNPLLDDVLLTGVTDSVNNGGVCTVDTTGGLTVPGGGTKSYPYSCSYAAAPSPAAGKNTATVSWGAQTLASGAELAASSASFDKTFDFASASPTLVNNSI